MSKRIVIGQNSNGDDEIQFYENSVLQGTLKMFNMTFLFSRPINDGGKFSNHTVPDASLKKIYIGDKRYDRAYFIDYVVERGPGTLAYAAGQLRVVYKEGTSFSLSRSESGDDCGISFAFSVDGNNIILTATLTSTGGNAELKITTKTIGR